MNRSLQAALCLLFLCLFTTGVFGWNKVGHMTVAGIAYRKLQSTDQAALGRINTLLRSHMAYNGWRTEYNTYSPQVKARISLEAYVFMRAAAWPDDVRGQTLRINGVNVNTNDWKPWHYINYPVRLSNNSVGDTPLQANIDILRVFRTQGEILRGTGSGTGSDDDDKARSLSWVFHLVGDIHQPLHGAALVHTGRLARGDAGGNLICLRVTSLSSVNQLHSFWDDVVRDNRSATVNGENAWLDANFFPGAVGNLNIGSATGPQGMEIWAKDSANVALNNVYKFNGAVPDFINANDGTCVLAGVTQGYRDNAERIGQRRMVLAGLRLAHFLSAAL